jgi:hypothetical protein
LPELRPQGDHRQSVQRHRGAVGASDDRSLHEEPYNATDQSQSRAEACELQQPPPQVERIPGSHAHGGGGHECQKHEAAEQRRQ